MIQLIQATGSTERTAESDRLFCVAFTDRKTGDRQTSYNYSGKLTAMQLKRSAGNTI